MGFRNFSFENLCLRLLFISHRINLISGFIRTSYIEENTLCLSLSLVCYVSFGIIIFLSVCAIRYCPRCFSFDGEVTNTITLQSVKR